MATDTSSDDHRNCGESSPLLENQDPSNDRNCGESSPLLANQAPLSEESEFPEPEKEHSSPPPPCKPSVPLTPEAYGWPADGVPMGVVGEPMGRAPWETGVTSCLGRQDEFCSSDLEVCLLGSVAPCLLYGSNVERLGSSPRAFASHCMTYTALFLIGNSFFGWNCLAPWLSYNTRTAIRRRFNLEGSFESLVRSHGCCEGLVEDDVQREQCETACDFATHVFCHPCALCQEGRELRRRLPHPAHIQRSVFVMYPPGEQTMDRALP